jgi:multisubunit Na+/H+ antiporter MnhG subunit
MLCIAFITFFMFWASFMLVRFYERSTGSTVISVLQLGDLALVCWALMWKLQPSPYLNEVLGTF